MYSNIPSDLVLKSVLERLGFDMQQHDNTVARI